jgi:hypothetical protein
LDIPRVGADRSERHRLYGEEWTEAPLDDALAVESCRTHLVIVSFRDAP